MSAMSALRRLPLARLSRCMGVSIFTTLLSMGVLVTMISAGRAAWVANVVATAVGTVPSYLLNRRWVWGRHGAGDPWREVLPFWLLSFVGLGLSTGAVLVADRLCAGIGLVGSARTLALLAANVSAFGVLWVAQFLLLDRVLFRVRAAAPSPLREAQEARVHPTATLQVHRSR